LVAPINRRSSAHIRNPRTDLYTRKMERAARIFEDLQEQSNAGVPIIVEGRRDEAALRKLGIKGTIHCLKATGEPRFRFIERLDGSKRAIVMTDFDREGGELGTWLYQELSHRGIQADNQMWRKIRALARTEVRSVEELPSFVRALEIRSRGLRP
jgi:5S rRNA maturation endonuclease (ribonuclease M5)